MTSRRRIDAVASLAAFVALVGGGGVLSGRTHPARQAPAATPQARAAELLARARTAIGPVDTVKSVSMTGARTAASGSSAGVKQPYELHFLLPDKFISWTSVLLGSDMRTIVLGVNGTTVLSGVRMASPVMGGGAASDGSFERRTFARVMLGYFLTTPSYLRAEYAYGGTAEAPDGKKAHAIDVKGDDFAARVFIDESTNRPMMLTYVISNASQSTTEASSAAKQAGASRVAGQREGAVYYSDFRQVGAFQLPFSVIDATAGKTTHETHFSKIVVNPTLKSDLFAKP